MSYIGHFLHLIFQQGIPAVFEYAINKNYKQV